MQVKQFLITVRIHYEYLKIHYLLFAFSIAFVITSISAFAEIWKMLIFKTHAGMDCQVTLV